MRCARRLESLLALGWLVVLALAGCSELPTAPRGAELASATTPTPRPASDLSAIRSTLDSVEGLITRTLDLVGSQGGSLTNARWSVVIPAADRKSVV